MLCNKVCLITVLPDCTSFILGYILKFRRPVIQSDLYLYLSHYFLLFDAVAINCPQVCNYEFNIALLPLVTLCMTVRPPINRFCNIHLHIQISVRYHKHRITLRCRSQCAGVQHPVNLLATQVETGR